MRAHPCHGCADREDHARWAERYDRLRRETDALERGSSGRTNTHRAAPSTGSARCSTSSATSTATRSPPPGAGWPGSTPSPTWWSPSACATGVWDGLDPAELAARRLGAGLRGAARRRRRPPRLPAGPVREALERDCADLGASSSELEERPRPRRSCASRTSASPGRPTAGPPGTALDAVLRRRRDLAAGDFVRWCKQLIDLLGQIADAAAADPVSGVREAAREAVDLIRRGVVAYSSVT